MKVSDKGQTAVTRYKVLGRGPDMTWLELRPETGRTHQIRVHCAAAGCPVIADRLYGTAEPGQQLHLHSRGIVLPLSKNKPPVVVEAPPPAHMIAALKACGYKATVRVGLAERPTRSRSPRLSRDPCKSLMPLVLPALVDGRSLSHEQRQERHCAFLARELGSPRNSDSYASFATGFRTQALCRRPRPVGMVIG